MQINNVIKFWDGRLGELAQEIIRINLLEIQNGQISGNGRLDPARRKISLELNERFYLEYDDPFHHAPMWHEYGILGHSRETMKSFNLELIGLLMGWDLAEQFFQWKEEEIEGLKKSDLFKLAVLFHDLGKYAVRVVNFKEGTISIDFPNHEKKSAELIRQMIRPDFKKQGLTDDQIDYIEQVAGLHYLLGDVRGIGRKSQWGYTKKYLESNFFRVVLQKVILDNKDLCREVGWFFIIDTLGKCSLRVINGDPAELKKAGQEIIKRRINPLLIESAKQMVVNLEAARIYLKEIIHKK